MAGKSQTRPHMKGMCLTTVVDFDWIVLSQVVELNMVLLRRNEGDSVHSMLVARLWLQHGGRHQSGDCHVCRDREVDEMM